MSNHKGRKKAGTPDETAADGTLDAETGTDTGAENEAGGDTDAGVESAVEAEPAGDSDGDPADADDADAEGDADDENADADGDADEDDGDADDADDDAPAGKGSRTPKRLPRAQEISGSAGFTPHGLAKRGGTRGTHNPKALSRAARRRRRRRAVLSVVTVLALAAAGTGAYYALRPSTEIEVAGAFGKKFSVTLPEAQPSPKLESRYIIQGKGPVVGANDMVVAHYVGYAWKPPQTGPSQGQQPVPGEPKGEAGEDKKSSKKQLVSTFEEGQPESLPLSRLMPGLKNGLVGKKAGSRVLLTIPPKDGFGPQGNPEMGVAPTDTLVFVFDLLGAYGANAAASGQQREVTDEALPKVTATAPGKSFDVDIPDSDAPDELKAETLIEGTGPAVRKGQRLVAHYEGRIWRNGKIFDSSREAKQPGMPAQPAMFPIGVGEVVPGWDKGLVGKKIGSRVMLVIPSKDGYGEKGNPQAQIKGDDTMIFVVDILGAF